MPNYFVETCYRRPSDPLSLPQGVLFYHTSELNVAGLKSWSIIDDADDWKIRQTEVDIINRHGGQSGVLETISPRVYNATVEDLDKNGCPHHTG